MEPWEALDLDDSDLPSILRPCKRHQSQQSQLSPNSLSNPNFSSQHCPPTPSPPADNQPPPPPSRFPIPGPAGAMQAIIGRICHRNEDFSRNRDSKISTQDYIKMVQEDDAEEFTSDHWLSALDFLSREGAIRTTSLNDVKNCVNAEKIDMVVAMIKCCTPNGLGDMTVVLKDPTDTISASIHRKVLTEGDYGKQIAVGSVVILQQVSVFSPLNKSLYLNISLSNIVKFVHKDARREIYNVCTTKEDVPERRHKSLKIPEQASSSVEKHFGDADQNSNIYASLQLLFKRDHAGRSNIREEPVEVDLVSSNQEIGTQKMARLSDCIVQPDIDSNIAENLGDEHEPLFENLEKEDLGRDETQRNATGVEKTNVSEKTNNLTPSKASFQQWTDDQLDILDMDD